MSEEATLDDFAEQGQIGDVSDEHPRFGSLPDDWEISEIASISEVVGGSTPSTSNENYWGGGIPWATPTDITALSGNTISETKDTITEEGLESASTHLLPPESVLMTSRATIGKCAINTVEMATNQGFKNLVPSDEIEPWYLYYRMLDTAAFLNSLGSGSTFDEVSKTEVQTVDIPVPPLPEQRKIATVLHTVDQAIEKTGEIIEKIKRTKAGTSQKLFRYGFFEHDTESRRLLGEIPKDWDVVKVGEICERVTDGTHRAVPAQETGMPCLTAKNIRDWGFDLDDIKYISEEEHKDIISRCHPEKGDLLYVKDGANTGMVQVNTLDFEFSLLNSVILMKVNKEVIDPHFFEQMLSWEKMKKLIVARRTGTGIRRVTITNMEKSEVLVPPIEEQRKIAEILTGFDEHVAKEMELQERLKHLKRGLMQDLLSGTVRTTDNNIEVPEEITRHG